MLVITDGKAAYATFGIDAARTEDLGTLATEHDYVEGIQNESQHSRTPKKAYRNSSNFFVSVI